MLRKCLEIIRLTVQESEFSVLLFPVVVVLLSSITFLLGGSCSKWHWWLAYAIVSLITFVRSGNKVGSRCLLFTLAVVLGCCFASWVSMDSNWVDNIAYHLPGTRMLIDGWNPIIDATPEKIGDTMKVNPFDMRVWHILSVHKSVWIFNAVAAMVHGDPLSITLSAGYFVYVCFALFVITEVKWHWVAKAIFCVLVWSGCLAIFKVVDSVVGISGLALLMAMQLSVNDKRFHWLPLLVFSFWMITAKASGTLACFAMWGVFSLFYIRRNLGRKSFLNFAFAATVLSACFIVVCASPYLTAWKEYGHPLYPAETVDEERYPHKVITEDLLCGNDDRMKMGIVGSFANAYLSPTLTRAYYMWRLKKAHFEPMTRCWFVGSAKNGEPTASCPTTFRGRFVLWGTLIVLLLHPKTRMLPFVVLAALIFVPHPYYGYMRYFPWTHGAGLLAVMCLAQWFLNSPVVQMHTSRFCRLRCVVIAIMFVGMGMWGAKALLGCAVAIDCKLALHRVKIDDAYVNVYGQMECTKKEIPLELLPKEPTGCGDPACEGINALKLLSRHVRSLNGIKIHGVKQSELENFVETPMGFFTPHETSLPLTIKEYNSSSVRWRRIAHYPIFTVRMFTEGLFRLVTLEDSNV